MSTSHLPTDRPFVIVVALDLSDTGSGGYALDQAGRIAFRIPESQLHVLHVSTGEPKQETLGLLRHYVSEKLSLLEGGTSQRVAAHVRGGDAAKEIAQFAADLSADLIIVGTHKSVNLKTLMVGSTAERVMARATCPVLVAGPKPKPAESHVIVIEPPCTDCVRKRLDTRGHTWWCARHAEHHAVLTHHHLYSYEGPEFASHDSEVSPTGVDTN
jgi:nucleotide-binding universal stress UspA family protein